MPLNTTATLSVDTVFQQQDTETNSFDNRQGSVGYSQALTSGTGSLNINALREKYDASITIFGAPFIFPGMYIYIDPNMIGMGSGQGARDVSASRVLGLGGYYFINKVSNSISSDGNFETQLEASWNSFAPPDCSLPDIVTISPQSEAIYEIGAADQVSGGGDATPDPTTAAIAAGVAYGPGGIGAVGLATAAALRDQ